MADVRVNQTPLAYQGITLDWLLTPMGLDQTLELATAAIIALGTDGLAAADDDLPDPDSDDRCGWWGDLDANEIWGAWPIGSKLWLLRRAKITDPNAREGATINNAQFYGMQALQPFVDHKIATAVDVEALRVSSERIDMLCTIYRGPNPPIQLRYQQMWDEMQGIVYTSLLNVGP